MRRQRIRGEGKGYYHCLSRVVPGPGVELHLATSRRALSKQEIEGIVKKVREHL